MKSFTNKQEDINITKIEALKFIKQILTDIKREIDSNTTIVGTLTPHLHR